MVVEVTNYVRGVVFDTDNNVLLQMRADCPIWELPGGGVDPKEIFRDAVIREVFEETGLTVDEANLFGLYYRWVEKDNKTEHAILYSYICKVSDLTPLKLTDESIKQTFFKPDNLPTNTHPYYKQIITDAAAFLTDGILREYDLSSLPRVSYFVETIALDDIHDFDFWYSHPVTLDLLAKGELPDSAKLRFFKD